MLCLKGIQVSENRFRRSQPPNDPRNAGGIKNEGLPKRNRVPCRTVEMMNTTSETSATAPVVAVITPAERNHTAPTAFPAMRPSHAPSDHRHAAGRLESAHEKGRPHALAAAAPLNADSVTNNASRSIVFRQYRPPALGP